MINLNSIDPKVLSDHVKAILQREFGELPDFGIAAGQAIASAIYEAIDLPVSTRFKDLDIFVNMMDGIDFNRYDRDKEKLSPDEFSEKYSAFDQDAYRGRTLIERVSTGKIKRRGTSPMSKNPRGHQLKVSDYGELSVFAQISKNHYAIVQVENPDERPELNYIGITYTGDPEAYQRTVIEGFDINMVQASFNLETGELDWTPEFQNFLFSRQIRANTIPTTPVHTAVRLLEKEQLFDGVTLDYEQEIKRLQDMKMLMDLYAKHNNTRLPNTLFGDGFMKRIEPFKERYSQYWDIQDRRFFGINGFVNLLNAVPKSYTPEIHTLYKHVILPLVEGEGKRDRAFNFESVFDIFQQVQALIHPVTQKEMRRSEAYKPYLDQHIEMLNRREMFEDKRNQAVRDKDVGKIKAYQDEIRNLSNELKPYQSLAIAHLYNNDFSLSGLQPSTIKRWMGVCHAHPQLSNQLLVLPRDDQFKAIKNIRWLDKRRYGHVIGLYESGVKPVTELVDHSPAQIVDDYNVYAESMREKTRKDPLIGDFSLKGIQCSEIVTMFDLEEQGRREMHCVGGYWEMVNEGKAIVVAMESKDAQGDTCRSTLMFTIHEGMDDEQDRQTVSVKFNQHYARSNTQPPESHIAIVEQIKEAIEDAYLEKGYRLTDTQRQQRMEIHREPWNAVA
jgi:hypothetical protein